MSVGVIVFCVVLSLPVAYGISFSASLGRLHATLYGVRWFDRRFDDRK